MKLLRKAVESAKFFCASHAALFVGGFHKDGPQKDRCIVPKMPWAN